MRRKGIGLTQHVERKKRQVVSQQLLRKEFKERNARQAYRMVQKIKCGYKPHTDLCKDTKGNIFGNKEQIKVSWKEDLKGKLNKNKHKNKAAALSIE